ncbi:MAG TPA: hypothetical protein VNS83_03310, partial [Lapillicoccus sp.]|nr:hypothetical protein [Lapillicoccus sp.]
MAWITDAYLATWQAGDYLGARQPTTVVEVRRGSFRRAYRAWAGDDVNAVIPGEEADEPWYPIFTETTAWVDVPNIISADFQQSFDERGITAATIAVDNVGHAEQIGTLGDVYHLVQRGYLSPLRGHVPPQRPDVGLTQNAWFDVLTEMANIRVWEGFGPPVRVEGAMPEDGGPNGAWVFNGLIDDVDTDSEPAQLRLVARTGKTLTDGRVFGWNKSKQLKDPITFSDRLEADDVRNVGDHAEASSTYDADSSADNVVDDDGKTATYWRSDNHSDAAVTEWVEIKLPVGRYETIVLDCDADMEAYIGVYVRAQTISGALTMPTVDGDEVDEGFVAVGMGVVPGANGGWPFIAHVSQTN